MFKSICSDVYLLCLQILCTAANGQPDVHKQPSPRGGTESYASVILACFHNPSLGLCLYNGIKHWTCISDLN